MTRLENLNAGDIIETEDGFRLICIPSPDGNIITDGDIQHPCSDHDGFDVGWKVVRPEDIDPSRLESLRSLLYDAQDDSPKVLAYESRIADEFNLTIDDMNSEGTLFTGEPGKIAHFVYVGLGATIHPRNPDEDWANVTSSGMHIGQIDYNLPRGRIGFSALNTPILPLLQRLFPENPS